MLLNSANLLTPNGTSTPSSRRPMASPECSRSTSTKS
ncbi:unnamed protein product [Calypogeia fissa]